MSPLTEDKRHLILIHGFMDSPRLLKPPARGLESEGYVVHMPVLRPNDGRASIEELSAQLVLFIRERLQADVRFSIIGYSMGGLIARYYVQRMGGLARLHRLITIASPHNGTLAAYTKFNKGAVQMRPVSAFLRDLNSDADILEAVGFVSLWNPFDLMIIPASSSVLPVGDSLRFLVPAHPLMVRNKVVYRRLCDLLETGNSQ